MQLFFAPRCGAHARTTGKPCKSPAMPNGRCRMHGGTSTGRPKIHGRYSRETIEQKTRWRETLRILSGLIEQATPEEGKLVPDAVLRKDSDTGR